MSDQRLRAAKNIVIVGYSMPRTDVYMQYFLKAAFGPNINLDKVSVFDPVLFSSGDARNAMEDRYSECFSSRFRERIEFRPPAKSRETRQGSFGHFVDVIGGAPKAILF